MRNPSLTQDPAAEAIERREWLESLDYVLQSGGPARAAYLLRQLDAHARRTGARIPFTANTPYANTIPVGAAAGVPRKPADRAAHQEPRPLERALDGGPRQQAERRHRRPHLDLRLGRDALRGRLQPLLPRPHRHAGGRHRLLPGPRRAGHLRARVPRRPPQPAAARELPARARGGRRPVLVPAPVADAEVLAVPDRVDGPRADHGDLPGPLQPLPRGPRPEAPVRSEGLGLPRRRRDRRARDARRDHARRRAKSSTT